MLPSSAPSETRKQEDYAERISAILQEKIGALLGSETEAFVNSLVDQIAAELLAVDTDGSLLENDKLISAKIAYELDKIKLFIAHALTSLETTSAPQIKTAPPQHAKRETPPMATLEDVIANIDDINTQRLFRIIKSKDFYNDPDHEKKITICKKLIIRTDANPQIIRNSYLQLIKIYKKTQNYTAGKSAAENLLAHQRMNQAPGQYLKMTEQQIQYFDLKILEAVSPETPPVASNDDDLDSQTPMTTPAEADEETLTPIPIESEAIPAPIEPSPEEISSSLQTLKDWITDLDTRAKEWLGKGAKKKIPEKQKDGLIAQFEAKLNGNRGLIIEAMQHQHGFEQQLASLETNLEKGLVRPGLLQELSTRLEAQLSS